MWCEKHFLIAIVMSFYCLFIILCLPNLSVISEGHDFEVLFSWFSAFLFFSSKIRFYVGLICKIDNWIVSLTIIINNLSLLQQTLFITLSIFACAIGLEKFNVMWYFRGQISAKICQILVMFVYSLKM